MADTDGHTNLRVTVVLTVDLSASDYRTEYSEREEDLPNQEIAERIARDAGEAMGSYLTDIGVCHTVTAQVK